MTGTAHVEGNGLLDGIQLMHGSAGIDQVGLMGMTGPSMNTLKKSQSVADSRHPCVYQYGSCSFGDECKFAEIDGKVCAKFLKGGCSWGNNCCWKHTTNHKIQPKGHRMGNNRRNFQAAAEDNFGSMQDNMYNQQMDPAYNGMQMDRSQLQQQLQLQQLGLSGQQAGLAHDDLLPGIQGFSAMDDVAGQGFGAEGLGNHFPLAMGDDGQEIRDVSQFVQSIQERVKMFDECYNKRVAALQMEISKAEKDRSEEVERNRMSISSLMTNVDDLMKKLGERGVAVHQPMPQQAPMAAFSADVAGPTTTNAAAAVAAAGASKKVTVLQKPQSAYKQHNALFLNAVKAAAEKAEVFVDVQTSQQVVNNAVMFTETLGVVVSPDYQAGDNFEGITTGIAGGTGLASEKLQGESSTFFAQPATSGSNPTGLLLAAAGALKQLGLSAEATKIEGAVKKASSGSTETAAFTKAVVAAL
eukprot:Rhum_TRINITY_DN15381_c4_g2::Rhum_TRINITY_DN15381_c4_g2_i1::g.154745::m.154745